MKIHDRLISASLGLVATGLFSLSLGTLAAPVADAQLDKVIRQGKDIFSHDTFNGNGRVCESCHLAGGAAPGKLPDGKVIPSLANAAAIFPRYKANQGRVFTLEDQIRSCTAAALEGKSPAYGSEELNALVTYVTSLAQGKPIDMGGKPQ